MANAKNQANQKRKQAQKQQKRKVAPKRIRKERRVVANSMATMVRTNNAIANSLCTAITLPHETRPVRFPIQGVSRKTAVLKLRGESSVNCVGGGSSRCCVMLVPSPVHPVWCTQRALLGPMTIHVGTWGMKNDSATLVGFSMPSNMGVYPGTVAAGETKSGEYLIYVPPASEGFINFNVWGAATSVTITFRVMRTFSDFSLVTSGPHTLVGGAASVEIPSTLKAAWVMPDGFVVNSGTYQPNSGNNVALDVKVSDGVDYLLPAFSTLEIDTLFAVNNEARVNSCSVLMTNTSPAVQKCGTIDAATLEYSRVNIFDFPNTYTNVVTRNSELRYNGPGDKGCYSYAYPTPESQTLSDYTAAMQFGNTTSVFRLEDAMRPSVIYYTGSDALTTSPGSVAQTFVLLYDEHREFVTTSQIFRLGNATHDLQDFQLAVRTASIPPPFTENPIHWGLLANLVWKGLKAATPYLKPMARAAVNYGSGKLLDWLE